MWIKFSDSMPPDKATFVLWSHPKFEVWNHGISKDIDGPKWWRHTPRFRKSLCDKAFEEYLASLDKPMWYLLTFDQFMDKKYYTSDSIPMPFKFNKDMLQNGTFQRS